MHQFDTFLTMYALKQAEAVISQSNAIFDQIIDHSFALNRAMINLDFVDMTPVEIIEFMFSSITAGSVKKNPAQPNRASETKALAQTPASHDDLKLISGVGPVLEKKLRDAGITSYSQIATLTLAEIVDLEANVVRFAGRIERDNWIGQAKHLMNT